MPKTVALSGRCSPTPKGKRLVGMSMYSKGKAFVGAALLLDSQCASEPTDYVVLYLLCQGFEVTLKGLLLLRDYDRFEGRLQKPIGHNLVKLANSASKAFGIKPVSPALMNELAGVNSLYSSPTQFLRYGNEHDIPVDPRTVTRNRIFHRLAAVIRLAERELPKSDPYPARPPSAQLSPQRQNIPQ